ncbi:MAG: zinc-binding dehydrogenase [Lactobacillus sp.]|jgi:NADPH:quinone reductase-like Zn-dependent oxidoreductase|nr:zinc-binding dehydrogenase [Lactobacillus sp.]
MEAIVQQDFNGIDSLTLKTLPQPRPNPMTNLIQVKYNPVLPYDILGEQGALGQVPLPRIIGYGFAGTVVQAGALNTHKVGQRVIGVTPQGSFAQYVVPTIPLYTFVLPESVSLAAGATVIGGADAAWLFWQTSGVQAGDSAVILGASGGVGTYLVQLLTRAGVQVHILASKRSAAFIKTNFKKTTVYEEATAIPRQAMDYLFDLTGNIALVTQLEAVLKPGGQLLVAGLPDYTAHRADIRVQFSNHPLAPTSYQQILTLLQNGDLKAYIDTTYNYQDIQSAQHHVLSAAKRGRTLVQFA